MALLSPADQEKLRASFSEMTSPVRLLFFTQALGCDTCVQTRQILDEAAITEASEAAAGPSKPMDNTDFSFLWRKQMTRKFVAAALRDLA